MHFRIIIQKQLSENKDQCYKNQCSEFEECKVRVLIVGSGGRESALAWKCKRSPLLTELFVAPGNPSLQPLTRGIATDIKALPAFVRSHSIDLVICGPEQHIAAGLADALQAQGSAVFAPSQACARLEASKSFAKKIMQRAAVPTAAWQAVSNADTCKAAALARLHDDGGVVLKADGLASGKGVFVCRTASEVEQAVLHLFSPAFAASSACVLVEELLEGRECSFFSFIGAQPTAHLGFAVDYKRLHEGDRGPNTGGMGSYCPVTWLPHDAAATVVSTVVEPLLHEMAAQGRHYRGCLYCGLMWTASGPRVLEFNVRCGDPETQAMVLSDSRDWLAMMAAQAGLEVAMSVQSAPPRASVAVVLTSPNYPFGSSNAEEQALLPRALFGNTDDDLAVFGAALQTADSMHLRTTEGRVLTVTAAADSLPMARARAYEKVAAIKSCWTETRFRSDIAASVE